MLLGVAVGVFCIECWSSDLRVKGTVRPMLAFLETTGDINVIHQRVVTRQELLDYLRIWSTYSSYPIGFLAMHGEPGKVIAGADPVTLEELADLTEDEDGEWSNLDLSGKVLYLGSCSTLRTHPNRIDDLRRNTRARLVAGYARNVPWHEAAAFEVLLLSSLAQRSDRIPDAVRWLHKNYESYVDRLRFASFPNYSLR